MLAPCIPGSWDGFRVRWRHGETVYEIRVDNPGHASRGIAAALMDGAPVDARAIPLVNDGAVHRLQVTMGEAVAAG